MQVDGPAIRVHFAVTHLDEALEGDTDDVVSDLEAFLWPEVPRISRDISGSAGPEWEGRQRRPVIITKHLGEQIQPQGEESTSRA